MRRFAPLVFALAIAVADPARAQQGDPDLPPPDLPHYWRAMDPTEEATTSNCIGNPATPLCAAEHIIACFVRKDDELCRIGMGLETPPGYFPTKGTPAGYTLYRVVGARVLQAGVKDIPMPEFKDPRDIPKDVRPGDTMLELRRVECYRNPDRCTRDEGPSYYYFLRKSGDRWVVVEWVSPYWH